MTSGACTAVVSNIADFRRTLTARLRQLYFENYIHAERKSFIMPVGLFLVIDEENGGDVTARELLKRFNLLHAESQNIIDFYFLGWEWMKPWDRSKGIRFNLDSFQSCRDSLKAVGVDKFGGNADLILVDAHFTLRGISLNFEKAIYVNLSSSAAEKEIPPIGEFLQSIIQAAERVRESAIEIPGEGVVFSISDKLGLATAKKSFLDFIYKKLGDIIGAKKLQAVAVRSIGPRVKLRDLPLKAIPQGRDSSRDY
jgi:hypothetical protein